MDVEVEAWAYKPHVSRRRPQRCGWSTGSGPTYLAYHDTEWGVPQRDPQVLFEFLDPRGRAGRAVVVDDPAQARRLPRRLRRLRPEPCGRVRRQPTWSGCLADPGIVRNRAKITAAIGNARAWLELDDPSGSCGRSSTACRCRTAGTALGDVPATTPTAEAMSKELKRRGFRFVGPTICYALMQACGIVNDHVTSCFRHAEVVRLAD